jgi:hypothetical protein
MLGFATAGQVSGVVVTAVAGWGVALGAAPTMFQAASAKAAEPAIDVAQAMLVTVLNAGMAAGAALGGLALGAGTGTLGWISLAIFAATLVAAELGRRQAFPPPRNPAPERSGRVLSQPSPEGAWTVNAFYHLCFVVQDIDQAASDLSRAVEVTWSPVRDGRLGEWAYRIAFSTDGPPFFFEPAGNAAP